MYYVLMPNYFNQDFFIKNRFKIQSKLSDGIPIIVAANGLLQRSSDTTYPFQQDSNFWYLTGIDLPDLVLVMVDSDQFIIVPGRSSSREAFDGAVDFDELTSISGVRNILNEEEGWNRLRSVLSKSDKIYMPEAAPQYIESHGMYTNPARSRLAGMIREHAPSIGLEDIRMPLSRLRMIKQPQEQAALQQAIDITSNAIELITAPGWFRKYKYEYEIEADLTREFRFRGSSGHAFAPIIASGKQGCTLHNVSNAESVSKNSLVIMDVGAEIEHYAADITRTRIFGKPSARQQAVFDAVLDVQAYALSLIKPGTIMKTYEKSVETYMGKTLKKLHLVTSDNDYDAIRKYYPHATSHFLGLDVHDVGDYSLPLEPGVVLTCEPGIYIHEEQIGVRIEDDILITVSGNRQMSIGLSKTLM